MKQILFLLAVVVGFGAWAETSPQADVVFLTPSHFGGFGRLTFVNGKYQLVGGLVHSYVTDGKLVRQMRADERGGSMANPVAVAVFDGKIFGLTRYNEIDQYDSTSGDIGGHFSFGKFESAGADPALFVFDRSLVLVFYDRAVKLDSSLRVQNEVKFDWPQGRSWADFKRSGKMLKKLESDDPKAYTECMGVCHIPPEIRETTLDLGDFGHVKPTFHKESIDRVVNIRQAVPVQDGWLLAALDNKTMKLQHRLSTSLAKVAAERVIDGSVAEMAVDPEGSDTVWLVINAGAKARLAAVKVSRGEMNIYEIDLPWMRGSSFVPHLRVVGSTVYLAANNQFAIYEGSSSSIRQILQQDFSTLNVAPSFEFGALSVGALPPPKQGIDRARFNQILKKVYWDESDRVELESMVSTLRASDKWAVDPLIESIKTDQGWFSNGPVIIKGLTVFGPSAKDALPILLKNNLGSSIFQPHHDLSFVLIKKIDPTGALVLPLIQPNLSDAMRIQQTVQLLEFIGSPTTLETAKAARVRWKLRH